VAIAFFVVVMQGYVVLIPAFRWCQPLVLPVSEDGVWQELCGSMDLQRFVSKDIEALTVDDGRERHLNTLAMDFMETNRFQQWRGISLYQDVLIVARGLQPMTEKQARYVKKCVMETQL